MSTEKQTFEDAWMEGEAPAAPEHAKKKQVSDAARTAEAEAFANSWKELKDE